MCMRMSKEHVCVTIGIGPCWTQHLYITHDETQILCLTV